MIEELKNEAVAVGLLSITSPCYILTSSHMEVSLAGGFLASNLSEMKSTTSWLESEFQMPSHAKTMNGSVAGSMVRVFMSGTGEIICSVRGSDLFVLYA